MVYSNLLRLKRLGFLENFAVCVKAWDKPTHHPLLLLDWGYTPALTEEIHHLRS